MAASPMEQFEVKPLIPIHVGGYDISFTNQALWMCVVVGAVSLFMAVALSKRSVVRWRKCPTSSSPT
jgi:F-type H+-transporting ATPase subunit a